MLSKIERAIFVGPSLYGIPVERFPQELWLSPARQGDILRIASATCRPRQILLIDGLFYQSLSVWHKEIVYALLEGITVIGAASMGALRAAEMHRYGMIGVGKIFEMYRDGEEDDSLVALQFDPETYRPISYAPVESRQMCAKSFVGHDRKRLDAIEALEFARSYKGEVKTSLDRSAISPYLQVVIDRILKDDPVRTYG